MQLVISGASQQQRMCFTALVGEFWDGRYDPRKHWIFYNVKCRC